MNIRSTGKRAIRNQSPWWVRCFLVVGLGLVFLSPLVQALLSIDSSYSDVRADWLATKAFYDGINPYQSVELLSKHYGVSFDNALEGTVQTHPRTPGALVLQWPLTLVGATAAGRILIFLGFAAIVGLVGLLSVRLEMSDLVTAIVSVAVFSFGPAKWGLIFFTQSPILGFMSAMAVVAIVRSSHSVAGVAVGLVGTMKLFPLMLIFPLVRWRRWSTVGVAVVVTVGLNLIPLLWDHVQLRDLMNAMSAANSNWFELGPNVSFAALVNTIVDLSPATRLGIQVALVVCSVAAIRIWPKDDERGALAFAMAAALLISPLSWTHYVLLFIPFVVVWAAEVSSPRILTGVGLCCLLMMPLLPASLYSVALILLAGLIALHAWPLSGRSPVSSASIGTTDRSNA